MFQPPSISEIYTRRIIDILYPPWLYTKDTKEGWKPKVPEWHLTTGKVGFGFEVVFGFGFRVGIFPLSYCSSPNNSLSLETIVKHNISLYIVGTKGSDQLIVYTLSINLPYTQSADLNHFRGTHCSFARVDFIKTFWDY